ncbi:deoxyribose-phosphate aldolase [Thermovirga lienii]|jgi:deoxyribose-phosphate aldolase|uniref:deoxyribose-phosphate aldolase n=1 Tax=Thermovirga lienii TaxID=336261 RepID=UPI00264EF7D6|nr:deoxyribose-phosphate aldolase [Thermovirga sp.]MDN5368008.1 deoxyribose-phosphate aldolase [Thermovirga sp.]
MDIIEMLAKRAGITAAKAEAGFYERVKKEDVIGSIDHTLLSGTASPEEIINLCEEAVENQFAGVCIYPAWVPLAREVLQDKPQKICTVVAFPSGALPAVLKAKEIEWARENGADEVDVVLNIVNILKNDKKALLEELKTLREAAGDICLKAIIETNLLTNHQKAMCVTLAEEARIDYIKTGTGEKGPVTFFDVAFLKSLTSDSSGLKIKAAGGIRSMKAAEILVALGASRLGTSKALELLSSRQC